MFAAMYVSVAVSVAVVIPDSLSFFQHSDLIVSRVATRVCQE